MVVFKNLIIKLILLINKDILIKGELPNRKGGGVSFRLSGYQPTSERP